MPSIQHLIPESQTPETLITADEEMSVQQALEQMIKHDWLFRILYAGFTGLNEFSKLSALSYSP